MSLRMYKFIAKSVTTETKIISLLDFIELCIYARRKMSDKTCPQCGREFNYKNSCKRHIDRGTCTKGQQKAETPRSKIECDECHDKVKCVAANVCYSVTLAFFQYILFFILQVCDIRRHYRLKHSTILVNDKSIFCEHCGRAFDYQKLLDKHISSMHTSKEEETKQKNDENDWRKYINFEWIIVSFKLTNWNLFFKLLLFQMQQKN